VSHEPFNLHDQCKSMISRFGQVYDFHCGCKTYILTLTQYI